MSKSLHNLYRFLRYSTFLPLLYRDLLFSSFIWHEIFPECIDCLIKRHAVAFVSPFLLRCFPLISWAYLFVCKTHTANAKDLFAVGKTISVTHLFSCFLRFTSWLKCAAKMLLLHCVTYAQLGKTLENKIWIILAIFHIWKLEPLFMMFILRLSRSHMALFWCYGKQRRGGLLTPKKSSMLGK